MNLNHFLGKACSIFTTPVNRGFTDKQYIDHFVCFIEAVDEHGVLGRHPVSGCKNYYNRAHVVAIIEEEVKGAAERTPAAPVVNDYVDYNDLANLSLKSKALGKPGRGATS